MQKTNPSSEKHSGKSARHDGGLHSMNESVDSSTSTTTIETMGVADRLHKKAVVRFFSKVKTCIICGSTETYVTPKGKERWYKQSESSNIICSRCKSKSDYEKNKEKIKNYVKNWRGKNPKKVTQYYQNYEENNKISILKSKNRWKKRNRNRIITFKDKQVLTDTQLRTGTCNICRRSVGNGDIKMTHMHHVKYDPDNPEAHTIEVCPKCHVDLHTELRNNSKKPS